MSLDVEALFRKYGSMVHRRCLHLLNDSSAAEDISQEVFVKLIEKQDTLTDEFPSSLLWNIATRLCLNRIRDRKHRGYGSTHDLLENIACLDEGYANLENQSVLNRLFGKHPESTRTIAVLHFVDGMTLEEVAIEVKMSVSGVRKRIRTLRSTLNVQEDV
jgi:RNA polymerase sigma-70 factor (ECF subfamily)